MKNFELCKYTFLHRKALNYLVNRVVLNNDLRNELLKRVEVHDVDKMLLYQFFNPDDVHSWHKLNNSHHLDVNELSSDLDRYEAILDYESSAMTKPDKPLNAWSYITSNESTGKFSQDVYVDLIKKVGELHLNCEQCPHDYEYQSKVTEEDIMYEIINFVTNNPEHPALKCVKEKKLIWR